jgi:pimeloyl-ACP methyl ester carboxylesterase
VDRHGRGRRVVLVGWSLGGVFAREVAKRHPDLIDKVVTLGSPFSGDPRANNAWRFYELIAGHKVDAPPIDVRPGEKPPVPTLALWSSRDGVVAPSCARGRDDESDRRVELDCSHMGFGVSSRAYPQIVKAIKAFDGI